MTRFANRQDAGRQLAQALPDFDADSTVVLALPRGGVPVAHEICKALGLPLDLLLVRKIGAPHQPELAVGAIVDGITPKIVVNPAIARSCGLNDTQIREMGYRLLPEIARRREAYLQGKPPIDLLGKTVIVVDDGIATGATMKASLHALQSSGAAWIILAVPVAPSDVLQTLDALADDVVCLETPDCFGAVGAHYAQFAQVTDAEVIAIMRQCHREPS